MPATITPSFTDILYKQNNAVITVRSMIQKGCSSRQPFLLVSKFTYQVSSISVDSMTDVSMDGSHLLVGKAGKLRQARFPPPNTPTDITGYGAERTLSYEYDLSEDAKGSDPPGKVNLTKIGRPIAHYLEVNDPVSLNLFTLHGLQKHLSW